MLQQDQHPTTEQLSTWLDQQLTSEEQAYCSAHLEECQQCQDALNNLQQTIDLLRSLPQLEVPRSFALPANFQITLDRNKRVEQLTAPSLRRLPTPLRHTLRAASALAAVIGLFFMLSSVIAPQPYANLTEATSMSAPPTTALSPSPQQQQLPQLESPNKNDDRLNTANNVVSKQPATKINATGSLPLFDLTRQGDRLSIGILLAILGSIGFVLFTQRQKHSTRLVKRN